VLAVGDAAFQQKCLGKMEDVARAGRTVLFVSHNLGAISSLTSRCLLLDSGRLVHDGRTDRAVSAYIASCFRHGSAWNARARNAEAMQIIGVRLLDAQESECSQFDVQQGLVVEVTYETRRSVSGAVVAVNVHAYDGAHVLSLEDCDCNAALLSQRNPGYYRASVRIPGNWLNSGLYHLRVGCGIPGFVSFDAIDALSFHLIETGDCLTRGHRSGYLLPMLPWETRSLVYPAGSALSA
jgi:lipopolysaccharide transport system ATP-binding protein